MLTNHQLRDLTRGLRQSEPSKSLPNFILSAEIHALICGYFASLSMTRLTAHRFLKASQKAEPTARRKGNATQSPLPCGGGWGWVVKGTPRRELVAFHQRKGVRQRQGFVILSVAKNPRKWILRFAQYDKAHGAPLFKSAQKSSQKRNAFLNKGDTATAGFLSF